MSNKYGITSRLKLKKIQETMATGKRLDGRGLQDTREIKIRTNVLEKAEGSAEVYLGNTRVLVGVKIGVGEPFEDTPGEGVLMCNAEFVPIASPAFEPGPPDENSIELARIVDRGLRSVGVVDFSELDIIPGKKVYLINVDIYILNHAGNLIDASAIAAIAALKKTIKPVYEVKDGEVVATGKKVPLEVLKTPIAVTMLKIGDSLIVDPSADEEEAMETRLTVTIEDDGKVCTMQKSGPEGLTLDEIRKAINIAKEKAPGIRSKIEETG
jgi:exosome complex component RRP42